MTNRDVIMEVIGFFIVPGEREEDEQQHFEKILNFQLVSEREDERQYELKNKIERLEVLKNNMIEFEKPSFHHIAKIDRFIKFCKEIAAQSNANVKEEPMQEISKLSDLICSDKSELIVESIKVQYKHIGGKRLKLLLLALQGLELIPKKRTESIFHRLCAKEFDWNINSLQSLNSEEGKNTKEKQEIAEMTNYIENLIK